MNKIVIDCKNVSFKYKTYKKSLGFKVNPQGWTEKSNFGGFIYE